MKTKNFSLFLFVLQTFAYHGLSALDQVKTESGVKKIAGVTTATENPAKKATGKAAEVALTGAKTKLQEILSTACAIGGLCNIAMASGKTIKVIKIYFNPSIERKNQDQKIKQLNNYYKKKKEFQECLIKHAQGKRNWHGRPKECEQLARMLKMLNVDGNNDLKEMTKIYKKVRKKYSRSFL